MIPNRMLGLALLALLGGCAGSTQSAVTARVTQATADLRSAISLYGFAKGLTEVATATNPDLAPKLASVLTTLDPLVAKAKVVLDDATLDEPAIEALAAQINAQANALTLAAAPAIKAVPSQPSTG